MSRFQDSRKVRFKSSTSERNTTIQNKGGYYKFKRLLRCNLRRTNNSSFSQNSILVLPRAPRGRRQVLRPGPIRPLPNHPRYILCLRIGDPSVQQKIPQIRFAISQQAAHAHNIHICKAKFFVDHSKVFQIWEIIQ